MSHHVKEERTGQGRDYGECLNLPCFYRARFQGYGYNSGGLPGTPAKARLKPTVPGLAVTSTYFSVSSTEQNHPPHAGIPPELPIKFIDIS